MKLFYSVSLKGSISWSIYPFVSYDQIERTSQKYRRIEHQMKVSGICLPQEDERNREIPLLFGFYFIVGSRFGQPFFTFFEGIIKGERK